MLHDSIKENIIYEPFKTLEEQEAFENQLEKECDEQLEKAYEEGTEEDIKNIELLESIRDNVEGRLFEKLTSLNE